MSATPHGRPTGLASTRWASALRDVGALGLGQKLGLVLLFAFPALAGIAEHGASTPFLLLAVLGLAYGWPAARRLLPWERRLLLGLMLFCVLISLSFLNSDDVANATRQVERYLSFCLFAPAYLLLRRLDLPAGKAVLAGLPLAPLAMLALGAPDEFERLSGPYGPIILGDLAALFAAILLAAVLTVARCGWHYALAGTGLSLAVAASLLSGSRGAWLAAPAMAALWIWACRPAFSPRAWLALVGGGAVLVALLVMAMPELFKARLTSVAEEIRLFHADPSINSSTGARLHLWRDSFTLWKDAPLLGVGVGDFELESRRLLAQGRSNIPLVYAHAHSIYFQALATTGLVGFAALLACVLWLPFDVFRRFWRASASPWVRFHALAGLSTVVCFAVFGLTEDWLARSPLLRTYLMCLLIFAAGIAVCQSTEREARAAPP